MERPRTAVQRSEPAARRRVWRHAEKEDRIILRNC